MTVTVRFAPSPTGQIHIGNARTALFNWLFALKNRGRFILRFDDTDVERSRQEYADQTLYDLHWLNIFPDAVEYQSRRGASHARAVERLKQSGVLYPCYETPEELDLKRKIRLSRKLPPIYGREGLAYSAKDRAAFEAEGRRAHWRFRLPNFRRDPFDPVRTLVSWTDVVRGPETVDIGSLSDPILVREDGTYLYTLPSVVDDIELGVTHVIRGDDHVTNTGVQIALFQALGATVPDFGHHNLLTTASGEGLSKRTGALSIRSLRESGLEPMSIASLAVLTGTSENVVPEGDMMKLAERFEPTATSRSAAKFDPDDLTGLNRALLQAMTFEKVSNRLVAYGVMGEKAEAFWTAIRGNLDRLQDVTAWWKIVTVKPEPGPGFGAEDVAFLREAFDLLPEEPWDGGTFKAWTTAVREKTGRKGKALFMPLRLALTGRDQGPELADLLPLLGREGTLARRP
ncbi:glutamate--tRNA ligase [Aquibium microcysteis]|uniref:glutamate--tRNA ligase n=1 Tax=Aquibium microcysteis TaxID=675281 RepID=UPI00165D1E5B|nr:glutamate--tRNA ligase [Aquibium microcysteis]